MELQQSPSSSDLDSSFHSCSSPTQFPPTSQREPFPHINQTPSPILSKGFQPCRSFCHSSNHSQYVLVFCMGILYLFIDSPTRKRAESWFVLFSFVLLHPRCIEPCLACKYFLTWNESMNVGVLHC